MKIEKKRVIERGKKKEKKSIATTITTTLFGIQITPTERYKHLDTKLKTSKSKLLIYRYWFGSDWIEMYTKKNRKCEHEIKVT